MKVGKKLVVLLAGVVALASVAFSGCFLNNEEAYLPEYESEYYRYAVRTMKDGKKEAYLVGFTELGLEQKYLILPEEFDGIKLAGLGYVRMLNYGEEHVGDLIHYNLEKLYLTFERTKENWHPKYAAASLEKGSVVEIYPSIIYFSCEGYILAYHLLKGYLDDLKELNKPEDHMTRVANVSYMYNYEGAENEGYYWADSYDQTTIDFIPPEPKREGYTFGGWYKEDECVNEWDFENDKLGEEIWVNTKLDYEDYKKEDITWLYARWVKE